MEEACEMVLELAIQAKELVEVHVQKLAAAVHEEKEEMAKVQVELNLQIAKVQLKA